MSFHSQKESSSPFSEQKSKYTNKNHKRKKHDSATNSKRFKSKLHKSITKLIRAILLEEFAEKEKLLQEIQYKLELKQK